MTSGVANSSPQQPHFSSAQGVVSSQAPHGSVAGSRNDPGGWQRIFAAMQAAGEQELQGTQSEPKPAGIAESRDSKSVSLTAELARDNGLPGSDETAPSALQVTEVNDKSSLPAQVAPSLQQSGKASELWIASASDRGHLSAHRSAAEVETPESHKRSAVKSGGTVFDNPSSALTVLPCANSDDASAEGIAGRIAATSHCAPHATPPEIFVASGGKGTRVTSERVHSSAALQTAQLDEDASRTSVAAKSPAASFESDPRETLSVGLNKQRPDGPEANLHQNSVSPGGNAQPHSADEVSPPDPSIETASAARQFAGSSQPNERPAQTHRITEKEISSLPAQPATNIAACASIQVPVTEMNHHSTPGAPTAAYAYRASVDSGETFAALDGRNPAPSPTWIHAGAHRAEAGYLDPALGWVAVRAEVHGTSVQASLIPGSTHAAAELAPELPALNAHLAHQGTQANVAMSSPDSSGGDRRQGNAEGDRTTPSNPSPLSHARVEHSIVSADVMTQLSSMSNGNLISVIV
jgi:hypothetical protein